MFLGQDPSMDFDEDMVFDGNWAGQLLESDPYRDFGDDVYRGATLGAPDAFLDLHGDHDDGWSFALHDKVSHSEPGTRWTPDSCLSLRRFHTAEVAPDFPEDPFFPLGITHLVLPDVASSEAANSVLDVLDRMENVSLNKVSYSKFSIKATATAPWGSSNLKIFIYSMPSGEVVVEFQRRSGDCIAFSQTFQSASAQIRGMSPPDMCLARFGREADVPGPLGGEATHFEEDWGAECSCKFRKQQKDVFT
mmetsp:Transcript_57133/g.123636  ORF Transcript_57133/g.123636 Transcript_57133/m.123636 type:complete len:249 (+) Transcript_57133:117-863(+)